jgi:hypothetical protein
MQQVAPPQYSPDGRWWWNGRAWVRVTWPVQTWAEATDELVLDDDEDPRRRTPAVLWVGLIALLALLLLAFGATITNLLPLQGLGIGGQAAPTAPAIGAPAKPAPTAAPTATPQTESDGADAYRQVIANDFPGFQAAGESVASSCTADALQQGTDTCRAALQSMDNAVQHFQSDLSATPVPACLRPADAEIRSSLALYHEGIQKGLKGIDDEDLGAIVQGAAVLNIATNHAQEAGTLLQNAC